MSFLDKRKNISKLETHLKSKQRKKRRSATLRFSMNLSICKRTPRRSSRTNSLLWQGIFVTSKICEPSLGSDTPKLNLDFFPTLGRLSDKKLWSSSVIWPANLHSRFEYTFPSKCSQKKRLNSSNCTRIRYVNYKTSTKLGPVTKHIIQNLVSTFL